MKENTIAEWITYLWVVGLSAWGGGIAYIHRVTKGDVVFSVWRFIGELATSAFVGIVTFFLCDAADLSWEITAAMVGISGHMGTRALFLIEKRYEKFLGDKYEG